jgi:hypothetical protein
MSLVIYAQKIEQVKSRRSLFAAAASASSVSAAGSCFHVVLPFKNSTF